MSAALTNDDDDIGLADYLLDGWFNTETGELAPGFRVTPADTLLDIGCGDGGFALFCARQGARLILADIDADTLEAARRVLADMPQDRIRTVLTDADPLPLAGNSVDKVVALEVIEHVRDPDQFVRELVRVAKPGALFLISVPGELSERLQETLAPPAYFQPPNHVRIFAKGGLAELVTRHGLIVEREMSRGFYKTMWWMLFWGAKQDIRPPWHPLLRTWNSTWARLLETEQGTRIKQVFDDFLPKNAVIIARKPGSVAIDEKAIEQSVLGADVTSVYKGSPFQKFGHISYSRYGEDLLIAAIFDTIGIERPSYLDIGARSPITGSNTALLHARGSRGVNAYASPDTIEAFDQDRADDVNLNIDCRGKPGSGTIDHAGDGRRVLTLDQIIDQHCGGKCPAFLTIDAKGVDAEILEDFSFSSRPAVVCIETGDAEDRITGVLRTNGFEKLVQLAANGIYVDRKWMPVLRSDQGPGPVVGAPADHKWLVNVHTLLAGTPRWWALMPRRWHGSRKERRLREHGLFDSAGYLARYPDVAGSGMDALEHYIRYGMAEGRRR